jgi:hypothetical protein
MVDAGLAWNSFLMSDNRLPRYQVHDAWGDQERAYANRLSGTREGPRSQQCLTVNRQPTALTNTPKSTAVLQKLTKMSLKEMQKAIALRLYEI